MQVYVEDAVGRFDDVGFPLDFRTSLVVYRNGEEVARGVTTVNDPLHYGGYRFHQSAYFPDGAALQVRDVATGRVVYDEVLALTSSAADAAHRRPRRRRRRAARRRNRADRLHRATRRARMVSAARAGRDFWIGARPGGERRRLATHRLRDGAIAGANAGATRARSEGENADLGGLSLSFAGMTAIPSTGRAACPARDGDGVAELSHGPSGRRADRGAGAGPGAGAVARRAGRPRRLRVHLRGPARVRRHHRAPRPRLERSSGSRRASSCSAWR